MLSNNEIKETIKSKILALADEFTEVPTNFDENVLILETGLLDSGGVLELISWYEDFFNIKIEESEFTLDKLGTINSMTHFIFKKTGQVK